MEKKKFNIETWKEFNKKITEDPKVLVNNNTELEFHSLEIRFYMYVEETAAVWYGNKLYRNSIGKTNRTVEINNRLYNRVLERAKKLGVHYKIGVDRWVNRDAKVNEFVDEVIYFGDTWFVSTVEHSEIHGSGFIFTNEEGFEVFRDILEDFNKEDLDRMLTEKLDERIACRLKYNQSRGCLEVVDVCLGEYLDINLEESYNSDLPEEHIQECLQRKKGGFFIFHGEPGTGKSTYIKHLIQSNPKLRFIIIDTMVLTRYQEELSEYLISNAGELEAVYVMEDCEKFIQDRSLGTGNGYMGLSDLLNMSDGILGDAIRIKVICTFNGDLTKVDSALLRPGRLFVNYEFKKLAKEKSGNLMKKLGFTDRYQEMTVAEIYHKADKEFSEGLQKKETKKIGF